MNKNAIEAIYPLSPMQQGMLFHTLIAPQLGVYCEQLNCSLHGELHISAFKRAWQQVIERHPILRTLFLWENLDKPLQVVYQQVRLPWVEQDWQGLSPVEQQKNLVAFQEEDLSQGFEFNKAPLMRLTLIRLTESIHHFIWSFHHMLLDGWSSHLVLKEVLTFYEAYRQEQPIHLERHRPYRDYILWLQQQDLSQAEAFWRQYLKGFTAPTSLAVEQTPLRRFTQETHYRKQQIRCSAAITNSLQSLTRQHQLTLNTIVQGVWALLLSHYSGEDDVIFGSVVSGRPTNLAGAEFIVGLFINTLPVRVKIPSQGTLLSWLKELQSQQVEARQYEYSSLVQIQGWSDAPRDHPLFESILVFENHPAQALQEQSEGLQIQQAHLVEQTNYALTVEVVPGAELLVQVSYDYKRFADDLIKRILGQYQRMLQEIAVNVHQRVSAPSLLTEVERQQMLVEWNATRTEYPQDKCFDELFEAQVEQTPDSVAVVCGEEHLTYQELNERANQLASHLQRLHIGPEIPVGICMERSLWMPIGLLGILKSGGVYVPLDPAYPEERLAYMLQHAQISVLITQQQLLAPLLARLARQITVICLDTDWAKLAEEPGTNLCKKAVPDNLAYIIYTSGSTGRPKGVMVHHRGLVNYLCWGIKTYALNQGQGIPVHSSVGFDLTVTSLFMPLLAGQRLVMLPEARGGEALAEALSHERDFSFVKLTPAHLDILKYQLSPDKLAGRIRVLIVGGEALKGSSLHDWHIYAPETVLINEYGPTETVVGCCVYKVPATDSLADNVPIGTPIANMCLYVLDRQLRPVPIGVPGELYIGGVGVARGYLQHPDLTAQSFIPHPFTDEPGMRLYRTGDQARYLQGGSLEFLGRRDLQTKIRGYRIEPGEIEAILRQQQMIQEAVVVAREDTPGEKQLVAYLIPCQGQQPSIGDLQNFLTTKLPDYMIPVAYVTLEALPLTTNGKLDYQTLPAPETRHKFARHKEFGAPGNQVEQQLVGIFAEVLKLEQVSVYDNFFALGGHSLLATQIISRIRRTFQVDLPLHTIFDIPEVNNLAAMIAQKLVEQEDAVMLDRLLTSLEHLSEEEAQTMLNTRGKMQKAEGTND